MLRIRCSSHSRTARLQQPRCSPARCEHISFTRERKQRKPQEWKHFASPHKRKTVVTASALNPFQQTQRISLERPQVTDVNSNTFSEHVWQWRGHKVKYAVAGCGKPVLLVHGFGASSRHWRFNIPEIAKQGYKVYAIDLLGLGGSDKPRVAYCMELWRDQIVAFVSEFMAGQDVVLVGNSIGSLACLMSNVALPEDQIRGTVLLNCAGAMNNKGVTGGDVRLVLVYPILLLVDFLLSIEPVARYLFDKFRTRDNVATVLKSVYCNKGAVDEELLDIIVKPSDDEGALHAFVSVITGPPGPKPWDLIPQAKGPLLILWGDKDPFTPLDGPVGKFMQALPQTRPGDTTFQILKDVGHCPHDDRPAAVHKYLLPWLDTVSSKQVAASAAVEGPC